MTFVLPWLVSFSTNKEIAATLWEVTHVFIRFFMKPPFRTIVIEAQIEVFEYFRRDDKCLHCKCKSAMMNAQRISDHTFD